MTFSGTTSGTLSGPDWIRLNELLDQALDLEPAARVQWVHSLPADDEPLRATLYDLLLRNDGLETSDVLRRVSSIIPTQFPPVVAADLVGPYRLIRQIGAGGMATVWLAERADGALQRQVALKLPQVSLLDRDLPARLNRERDILASLEHPGIARLYDAGVDAVGRPFLVMEYVDGVPLDHYATSNALPMAQRLVLFIQVARAVAYAHARLIVHRDLKPTNILVNSSGEVRLLDFGIAQLLQLAADAAEHQHGLHAFTPRYAAPEQLTGQSVTVATDVYALGVILKELLAAPGSSFEDADLEAIVGKALQHEPSERYETVVAFIDDIQRHRSDLPVRAHPDTASYRTRKFVRRHRAVVTLGAALLVTVVGGAAVSVWQAQVALRERDRSVRLYQEAEASNEFWNMVLAEAVEYDEPITLRTLLERSEQMADQAFVDAPLHYGVAMDAIAALYMAYGLEAKAHELTEQGLRRVERVAGGAHRAASLQCSFAVAIAEQGRVQEADEILRGTIDSVAAEPDLQQYCLQCRSYVARKNNDAANALAYVQAADRLSAQLPTQSANKRVAMMSELAAVYSMNGKADLAQRYYTDAMQLIEHSGRGESRAALAVLSGWATLATNTGKPLLALERLERAIRIQEKHSPDGLPAPNLMGNRANALAALARYDEALSEYERMRVRAAGTLGDASMVYALSGAADVHVSRGDLAAAQAVLDRIARETSEQLPAHSAAVLRLMLVKGRVLTQQGRMAEAREVLNAVIDRFDAANVVVAGRAKAYILRAELLAKSGDLDAALQDSQRAIDISLAARMSDGYSNMLGLALLSQGEIRMIQGARAPAIESLRAAVTNLENTLGAEHPETLRATKRLE